MSVLIPELENVGAPKADGSKPKKLLRGARRRVAREALAKLKTITSQDFRESIRAERFNYNALIIQGANGSATARAFKTVMDRLQAVLNAVG